LNVLSQPDADHRPGRLGIACSAILIIALAWLLLVPLARAGYDPLASGTTKLTLDKGFLALLKQNGVTVSAVAPAMLKGTTVTFPVIGGKFEPVEAMGTVEHEGALLFRAGNRKVPLKSLKLRTTQKSSPFSAKVGGSQLKIATVKRVSVAREGFGDRVSVSDLALSAKLATRLAKKLDRRGVFKAGLPIGSTATNAQPETITVLGHGDATFTLAPGFVAKLESLFVATNPIFPAEHQGPVFTLPIFAGDLATTAPGGRLDTSGAIEFLQLGGGQVFWREPRLDLAADVLSGEVDVEPSPPYAGKAGLLTLGPETTSAYVAESTARTVSGTVTLTLDPAMATTFNETFATPQGKQDVFVGGEALGMMTFSAATQ
jgi:hypothetical protein